MTAASGILHEELHSTEFRKKGGTFEMVQLWVNLPTKDKLAAAGYQGHSQKDIPTLNLADNAGAFRVIGGNFDGTQGSTRTFIPINVWDLRLRQNGRVALPIPAGHVAAVLVLHGTVMVNSNAVVREAQAILLDHDGSSVLLEAKSDATPGSLSGAPLSEPGVANGPFVMNTRAKIISAMEDFHNGRFGEISH